MPRDTTSDQPSFHHCACCGVPLPGRFSPCPACHALPIDSFDTVDMPAGRASKSRALSPARAQLEPVPTGTSLALDRASRRSAQTKLSPYDLIDESTFEPRGRRRRHPLALAAAALATLGVAYVGYILLNDDDASVDTPVTVFGTVHSDDPAQRVARNAAPTVAAASKPVTPKGASIVGPAQKPVVVARQQPAPVHAASAAPPVVATARNVTAPTVSAAARTAAPPSAVVTARNVTPPAVATTAQTVAPPPAVANARTATPPAVTTTAQTVAPPPTVANARTATPPAVSTTAQTVTAPPAVATARTVTSPAVTTTVQTVTTPPAVVSARTVTPPAVTTTAQTVTAPPAVANARTATPPTVTTTAKTITTPPAVASARTVPPPTVNAPPPTVPRPTVLATARTAPAPTVIATAPVAATTTTSKAAISAPTPRGTAVVASTNPNANASTNASNDSLAAPLSPADRQRADAERNLKAAHGYLQRGNLSATRARLAAAISAQPDNRDARRMRAEVSTLEQQRDALLSLARGCGYVGQWECASHNANEALRIDSSSKAARRLVTIASQETAWQTMPPSPEEARALRDLLGHH